MKIEVKEINKRLVTRFECEEIPSFHSQVLVFFDLYKFSISSNDLPSVSGSLKYTYMMPPTVMDPYSMNTPERPKNDFKSKNVLDVTKPIM